MKNKPIKTVLALLLTTCMLMSTACGQNAEKETQESSVATENSSAGTSSVATEEKVVDKKDLPVLTYMSNSAAITSGLVEGHRSDFFAENGFQLEVWAYSVEKEGAILASGDLPDIMYVSGNILNTMIEAGMVLNLEEHLDKIPHLNSSPYMEGAMDLMRKKYSGGTGNAYAIPGEVGEQSVGWADSTDRAPIKLRWDIYEEIGAPKINNFDDLIDVMEQMVKAHPEEADGTKSYGCYLDNSYDANRWGSISLWYGYFGYGKQECPFLGERNEVTGEITSMLTRDSLFYKALKWYTEINRRGLMDPDSMNTDRATQAKKVAMVPTGTLPGYAPVHYEYYIPGTKIVYDTILETGTGIYLVVSAETEHLEECLQLLDMWCNPDAVLRMQYGPEGDMWELDESGNAHITDNLALWLKAGGSLEKFPMSDGTAYTKWNTPMCVMTGEKTSYGDGKGGYVYNSVEHWDEVQEILTDNPTFKAWQKTTGYENWKEWLADVGDVYYTESAFGNVDAYLTPLTDSQNLTKSSLKNVVVPAAWKMVYSKDDAEFEEIWDQMVKDCNDLGAKEFLEWRIQDIENAMKLMEANN